jgi:WD40 repeat protein/tRNA A-37 threonylcarbamoyl transferase component Bud32
VAKESASNLGSQEWAAVAEIVLRFEDAWETGERPEIAAYLPAMHRWAALIELAHVDLERRLQTGEVIRVESYLHRFPELSEDPDALVALLAAEYRGRRPCEPELDVNEYERRFPQHGDAVLKAVAAPDPDTRQPDLSLAADKATLTGVDGVPVRVAAGTPCVPGYEILGELGRGGMGVVYKARQLRLRRLVALKVIRTEQLAPDSLKRFRAEARAVASLQHPNIVQIHEAGEQNGLPYLALEYVDGGSLADLLRGFPLPPTEAARLVETLARAVHAAHQRGIIHRDLKPANVLLQIAGSNSEILDLQSAIPKITDFGLAKHLQDDKRQTHSGAILGTPAYMAPEQAATRAGAIGYWTDVYALGAILYELLTGRPPFQADTALATLQLVACEEPRPPSRYRPKLPRDLETICLRCLAKEPEKRYGSAVALADDLRHFLAGEPVAARPAGLGERVLKWARRRPAWVSLVSVSCILFFGLPAGLLWHTIQLGHALSEKEGAQQAAQERERQANEHLYAVDIKQAGQYWKDGDVKRVLALLARHRPVDASSPDLRGFEWYHLWQLAHRSDRLTVCDQGKVADCAAFSPGGRMAAIAAVDGTVTLWHLDSGQEHLILPGGDERSVTLAFSEDGRTLAALAESGKMRVRDTGTGKPHSHFSGTPRALGSLAFTREGALLTPPLPDHAFKLWQTATAAGRAGKYAERVTALAFAQDGRTLLTGERGGAVRLWDAVKGKLTDYPTGVEVTAVALADNGRLAAVGHSDGRVHCYELPSWKPAVQMGHAGPVRVLTFSPDGQALASAGDDSTVVWWNVSGLTRQREFKGHTDAVVAGVFSADGRTLLTASRDGTVKRWDPEERTHSEPLPRLRPTGLIAFAPESRILAVAEPGGRVSLLNSETGAVQTVLRGNGGVITSLALAPNQKTLAVAGDDGRIRLWDVTGKLCQVLAGHPRVLALAFSPDGRLLASGGTDSLVRVWELAEGTQSNVLKHSGHVTCLAFTPDGENLVSFCTYGLVKLWDPLTGKQRAGADDAGWVYAVAVAPDGQTIATSHKAGVIRLWDLARLKSTASLQWGGDSVEALAFSADGKTLVSANEGLCFWDLGRRSLREVVYRQQGGPIRSLNLSLDGKRLITGESDGAVNVWNLSAWTVKSAMALPPRAVRALAFSPDGRTLITGSCYRSHLDGAPAEVPHVRTQMFKMDRSIVAPDDIRVWDVDSGREQPRLPGQSSFGVLTLSQSADGRRLASSGPEGAIWLRDADGRKCPSPLFVTPEASDYWHKKWDPVRRSGFPMRPVFPSLCAELRLSPDGRLLAATDGRGSIKVWKLAPQAASAAIVADLHLHGSCLAFSPDGKTIASGDGKLVHLWNASDGTLRRTFSGHRDVLRCVAFSADGTLLASAGHDRALMVWDLVAGRERASLVGHVQPVASLAFSPDGRTLASGAWDGAVKLWSIASGQELLTLEAHTGMVHALAFSPDGRILASGGESPQGGGEVNLWRTARSDGSSAGQ